MTVDTDSSSASSQALRASALPTFSSAVSVPSYDRAKLRPSIVHIGVGGFHRAHLATYIDDLCATGRTDWAIVGAGVLPGDVRMADILESQDHLYTLISRGADHNEVAVIGSIVGFIHAPAPSPDNQSALIDKIAAPETQIVSMTVTEGGYPVDDTTGVFVPDRSPAGGAFDALVRGLDARRLADGAPLTIMSCDNIMENGHVARTATLGEAARSDRDGLVDWIEHNVSFPNSMVDRITPVTSPADIAWLEATHGVIDQWPVVAEPFRQWVVEDAFAGERLPFEELDVIVTDDIAPYELTKLRLLNAGHSCLAYLASLAGFEAVDQAMADPQLSVFVENLLHSEAKPTLPQAAGIDLDDYIAALIERFANPGVGDQISRLCIDGTSKFPKFLLPTVRAQLDSGGSIDRAALALAGWCEYLARSTADGADAAATDPRLDDALRHAAASIENPAAFLEFADVFGDDLPRSERFVTAFVDALTTLRTAGVASAVTETS